MKLDTFAGPRRIYQGHRRGDEFVVEVTTDDGSVLDFEDELRTLSVPVRPRSINDPLRWGEGTPRDLNYYTGSTLAYALVRDARDAASDEIPTFHDPPGAAEVAALTRVLERLPAHETWEMSDAVVLAIAKMGADDD